MSNTKGIPSVLDISIRQKFIGVSDSVLVCEKTPCGNQYGMGLWKPRAFCGRMQIMHKTTKKWIVNFNWGTVKPNPICSQICNT